MTVVDASNSRRLVEYISQLTNQVEAFWNVDAILGAHADRTEADAQHNSLPAPEPEDWASGALIVTGHSSRNLVEPQLSETSPEARPGHVHADTTALGLGFCSPSNMSRSTGPQLSQPGGSFGPSIGNPDGDQSDSGDGSVAWQDLEHTAPLTPISSLSTIQSVSGLEPAWPQDPATWDTSFPADEVVRSSTASSIDPGALAIYPLAFADEPRTAGVQASPMENEIPSSPSSVSVQYQQHLDSSHEPFS